MRTSTVMLTLLTGALLAAPALAASVLVLKPPLVDGLERQADRLEARARETKGGPQHELLMRRAHLQELVDRLDRGEPVDPGEIDRLLNEIPLS